jgi:hypothetical protein
MNRSTRIKLGVTVMILSILSFLLLHFVFGVAVMGSVVRIIEVADGSTITRHSTHFHWPVKVEATVFALGALLLLLPLRRKNEPR